MQEYADVGSEDAFEVNEVTDFGHVLGRVAHTHVRGQVMSDAKFESYVKRRKRSAIEISEPSAEAAADIGIDIVSPLAEVPVCSEGDRGAACRAGIDPGNGGFSFDPVGEKVADRGECVERSRPGRGV